MHAGTKPEIISTNEMRFRDGSSSVREYDACHYMIYDGVGHHERRRRLKGHEKHK